VRKCGKTCWATWQQSEPHYPRNPKACWASEVVRGCCVNRTDPPAIPIPFHDCQGPEAATEPSAWRPDKPAHFSARQGGLHQLHSHCWQLQHTPNIPVCGCSAPSQRVHTHHHYQQQQGCLPCIQQTWLVSARAPVEASQACQAVPCWHVVETHTVSAAMTPAHREPC
jgi:hypothetical protein